MAALVCGIPYMLFLTRVSKFGMVTLLGLILGIVMFLSGHTWVPIVVFTLFAFIADCILKMGNYSSMKYSIISHGVFIMGIMGNMLPFFILRDYFMEAMRVSMGNDYVNVIAPFLNNGVYSDCVLVGFAIVCSCHGISFWKLFYLYFSNSIFVSPDCS